MSVKPDVLALFSGSRFTRVGVIDLTSLHYLTSMTPSAERWASINDEVAMRRQNDDESGATAAGRHSDRAITGQEARRR